MTQKKEETRETKTLWAKIGLLDYRIIYTVIAALVVIPLVYPLGTPMKVGQNVKDYADTIRNLRPGAVVLCSYSGYATMLPDVEPIYIATFKMFLSRDIKFICVLIHPDSPSILKMEFEKLNPAQYGKVYGKDFMFFPYFEMTEAAEIAFTANIRSIFTTDYNGWSLDDATKLPIMQNIKSAKDFDLRISSSPEYDVRRYLIPYGVKLICWGTGTNLLPFVPPFYPNQVLGYVGGASQGGELEAYTGYFGDGVRYNDAKNLAIVGLLIFVIIANISYFGDKFAKR